MRPDIVTPISIEADEFWNPVHERLPEPLHDVLVAYRYQHDEPSVDVAYRMRDGRWVLTSPYGLEAEVQPTHWMALPRPPEAA